MISQQSIAADLSKSRSLYKSKSWESEVNTKLTRPHPHTNTNRPRASSK